MKTRLYRVFDNESATPNRLIIAGSQAQAIRHVVGERYEATIATTREVATLVGNGVQVETAGEEAPNAE